MRATGPAAEAGGLEGIVEVLRKRTTFSSAAAYNLRILDSMLNTGSVERDVTAVTRLEAAGGIKAVLACLDNCKSSAGTSLLQAGCTVLNRVLFHRPDASATISELRGAALVINGLREVDERPLQAVEFLGLMAEGGQVMTLLQAGALKILARVLSDAMNTNPDADMQHAALLALGRIAAALMRLPPQEEPLQVYLDAAGMTALAHAVQAALEAGGRGKSKSLEPAVATLLWMAGQDGGLVGPMAQSGLHVVVLDGISRQEGESSEGGVLQQCGELLQLLITHDLAPEPLHQALERTKKLLDALEGPVAASAEAEGGLSCGLAMVAGVASSKEGRKRVMEATGVVDVLLGICNGKLLTLLQQSGHGDVTDHERIDARLVHLSLRALERLAADPACGRNLLHRGTMEAAMGVLKRSAASPLPGEVVAGAASLVARLTRVMMLRGLSSSSDDGRHGRKSSFGYAEAKLEALRCAISAYGRNPQNMVLFKGLLDLAFSNLRRGSDPSDTNVDETLMQASIDALQSLTTIKLLPSHQAVLRDRMWSREGTQIAAGCVGLEDGLGDTQLGDSMCHLMITCLGPAKARDVPFLLHYTPDGEQLHDAIVVSAEATDGALSNDRELVMELLKPMLELKPKLPPPPMASPAQATAQEPEEALMKQPGEAEKEVKGLEAEALDDDFLLEADDEQRATAEHGGPEPMRGDATRESLPELEDGIFDMSHDRTEDLERSQGVVIPESPHIAAPDWVEVLDSKGLAYFLNLSTGAVQWEVPDELTAWWDAQTRHRPQAVVKELNGWTVKVDPQQRVIYHVHGESRQWKLPDGMPVFLAATDSPRVARTHEPPAETPIAQDGPATADAEEDEQTAAYLHELDQLRLDLAGAMEAAHAPTFTADVGHWGDYADTIRSLSRADHLRPSDLERKLGSTLTEALDFLEDQMDILAYYKGMYERELTAHQRKGILAPLEATMAQVKGEVLRHRPGDLSAIAKIVATMDKNGPAEVEKAFKEAHLLIKRLVVEIAGEQTPDTHWTLEAAAFDRIPDLYWQQLAESMRVLVLSYDNMSDDVKAELTTASEIIKNRDLLVELAVRCAEKVPSPSASGQPQPASGGLSRRSSLGSQSSGTLGGSSRWASARAPVVRAPRSAGRRPSTAGHGHQSKAAPPPRGSPSRTPSSSRKPVAEGRRPGTAAGAAANNHKPVQVAHPAASGRHVPAPRPSMTSTTRSNTSPKQPSAGGPVHSPGRAMFDNFASATSKRVPVPATGTVEKRTPLTRAQLNALSLLGRYEQQREPRLSVRPGILPPTRPSGSEED